MLFQATERPKLCRHNLHNWSFGSAVNDKVMTAVPAVAVNFNMQAELKEEKLTYTYTHTHT